MRLRALGLMLFVTVLAASLTLARFSAAEPRLEDAQAKAPAAAQEPQQPIRVQVQLVNLFVTVRDKHKRIIPDLTQARNRGRNRGRNPRTNRLRSRPATSRGRRARPRSGPASSWIHTRPGW